MRSISQAADILAVVFGNKILTAIALLCYFNNAIYLDKHQFFYIIINTFIERLFD